MKLTIPAFAAGTSLVGALFFTLAVPVSSAGAQAASADVTDLSSQHDPRVSAAKRGGGGTPGTAGPRGGGGGGAGPPAGFRGGGGGGAGPPAGFRGPMAPRGPVGAGPGFRGPMVPRAGGGVVAPGYRGPVVPRGGVVAPGYRGPVGPGFRGPAYGFRPSWRGGRAAFHRGPYRIRRGGLLLPLVGLGALGAIYVGSRAYTPYAFVEGPAGGECVGPTDDGICELRMTEVPLESGGVEAVCVAYCPPE